MTTTSDLPHLIRAAAQMRAALTAVEAACLPCGVRSADPHAAVRHMRRAVEIGLDSLPTARIGGNLLTLEKHG